jgi:hypothetical protein
MSDLRRSGPTGSTHTRGRTRPVVSTAILWALNLGDFYWPILLLSRPDQGRSVLQGHVHIPAIHTRLGPPLAEVRVGIPHCQGNDRETQAACAAVPCGSWKEGHGTRAASVLRCISRSRKIIPDHLHPGHHLLSLLPSGRRYRSLNGRTNRLNKSLFPWAIRTLNTHKTWNSDSSLSI